MDGTIMEYNVHNFLKKKNKNDLTTKKIIQKKSIKL